jgi:preprotein translocase subunit SecB
MQENKTPASDKLNGHVPQSQEGVEFAIQHIYVKDASFESPNAPALFLETLKPETNVELNVKTDKLADDVYEVELTITVTMKTEQKVVFLVEVHQAGIFGIKGFTDEQLHRMLGSYCPNILFPYAREAISSLVSRGGLTPFYLTPINFEGLYEQQMGQQGGESRVEAG